MTDDEAWLARIQRCVDATDAWELRTRRVEVPSPGSLLEADDRALPGDWISFIAWSSIGVAVDNLGLIADAMRRQESGPAPPIRLPHRDRTVSMAAAQAISVMTGTEGERLRRARMIAVDDRRN